MKWFPFWYAKIYYNEMTGKRLNYVKVKDFNEKLFWLERYWCNPLVVQCSDKYAVRDFVIARGCGDILNELYGVYIEPNQIDFSSLPNKFVLKCTHGCGFNLFCEDKQNFDIDDAKNKLSGWLKQTYGRKSAEFHYEKIRPRIIAEKYIQTEDYSLKEYQLFCVNGEPQFFLARNDLGNCGASGMALSYTLNWSRIALRKDEDQIISVEFKEPKNRKKMIDCARKLSEPFPQVRVDFYEVHDRLLFGEMTFSTSGNILFNYKESVVKDLGKKLSLPPIYSERDDYQ